MIAAAEAVEAMYLSSEKRHCMGMGEIKAPARVMAR